MSIFAICSQKKKPLQQPYYGCCNGFSHLVFLSNPYKYGTRQFHEAAAQKQIQALPGRNIPFPCSDAVHIYFLNTSHHSLKVMPRSYNGSIP